MRRLYNRVHRVDRPKNVRNHSHCHKARSWPQKLIISLNIELTRIRNRYELEHNAPAFGELLPGHHVGVVFHDRQDDLVPCIERLSESSCYEIDRFGGAAGKHSLCWSRANEACQRLARVFITRRRFFAECVDGAMHVGARLEIEVPFRIQHGDRLLRGCGIVQIDDIGLFVKKWKLAFKLLSTTRIRFQRFLGTIIGKEEVFQRAAHRVALPLFS